jgi:hypothetical protein
MVDVGTWTALRDQGLEPGETVAAVTAMLACRLDLEERARGARTPEGDDVREAQR